MIAFPNAKINIGLYVRGKRSDGYHELLTTFYPIPLNDCLEILPQESFTFTGSGIQIDPGLSNLCVRAFELMKNKYPELPDVHIHLHKHIPVGAGLGGGSSDAASTLLLLNNLLHNAASETSLQQYALQLGSDCPFFLLNRFCLATGRGETLTPLNVNLEEFDILLINPGIHISTSWVFSRLNKYSSAPNLESLIQQPVARWKHSIHNELEPVVFAAYPEIGALKEKLYTKGAIYAAMSGSGSSVFGIFEKGTRPEMELPKNYFSLWL